MLDFKFLVICDGAQRTSSPKRNDVVTFGNDEETDDAEERSRSTSNRDSNMESSSLMPAEELCSDDSDTAGYYQVSSTNTSTSQSQNDSQNRSYQRGVLSTRYGRHYSML